MSWSHDPGEGGPDREWLVEYSPEFWDELDYLLEIADDAETLRIGAEWVLKHDPYRGVEAYPGSNVRLLHRTNKRGIRIALAYEIYPEDRVVYVLGIKSTGLDMTPM